MKIPYIHPNISVTQIQQHPSLLELMKRELFRGIEEALAPSVGTNITHGTINKITTDVESTLRAMLPGMGVACDYNRATGELRTHIDVRLSVSTAITGSALYRASPVLCPDKLPDDAEDIEASDTNDEVL